MGGACSHMGSGDVHSGFWWGNPRERVCLEDPSVDGRIILRWNSGNGMENLDWIDLAQGRGRLWVLVNVFMNLRVL